MPAGGDQAGRLLVTGFEPFGGRRRNRSWEIVERLGSRRDVQTVQLPVDFARLKVDVPELMRDRPRGLLLIGESAAKWVCVEQVALNVLDSDSGDNAGAKPQMAPVVPGGPLALTASWDAREIAGRLNRGGVPAVASFHAGTFACNAALYLALHACTGSTSVGFLHIPHGHWPFGMRTGILLRAVNMCLEGLKMGPSAR